MFTITAFTALLFFLLSSTSVAGGFSWPHQRPPAGDLHNDKQTLDSTPSIAPRLPTKLSEAYSTALKQLDEIEAQPICHRIAARLLINSCQILDGPDDTAVHTESGRLARDFVDSYAASLAICDLSRGSFIIPQECVKFQEATLAKLPPLKTPKLHVTSLEIDRCLEGLAQSDAAWSTWISYRHKSLSFCEAARAENGKDATVRLHQKITTIMVQLTDNIELELGSRFDSFESRFQKATEGVEDFLPKLTAIRAGLFEMEDLIGTRIARTATDSSEIVQAGLSDVVSLRKALTDLTASFRETAQELTAAHTSSMVVASTGAQQEVTSVIARLSDAVSSTLFLHGQLETAAGKALEISQRQTFLEENMKRLEDLAEGLLVHHEMHSKDLIRAQHSAEDVLQALDDITSSTSNLRQSVFSGLGLTSWWPYIICPVTSLIIGSYKLAPSAFRNLILVAAGEVAAITLAAFDRHNHETFINVPISKPLGTGLLKTKNATEHTYQMGFMKK